MPSRVTQVRRETILNINDNQLNNYSGKNADNSKQFDCLTFLEEETQRVMATLIDDEDDDEYFMN